jgi:D-glycero-alpha-D-manno-heptose-7-phosphate kinase
MQVTSEGSVRVDLVGGTIDLEPINLILPNVVTLNVATSLKAKVELIEE